MAGACSSDQQALSVPGVPTLAEDEHRGGGEPLPDLTLPLMRDTFVRWEVPLGVLPFQLRVDAKRGAGDNGIRVTWWCLESEPGEFVVGKASAKAEYKLDHPIASMAFLPDGRLLIGGVELGTRWPIFEIWTFERPKVELGAAGSRPFHVEVPAISSKVTVRASGDDSTYGCAQCLLVAPEATDDRVWMLTFPEYEVRQLDLTTGRSTLMLSSRADVGALDRWQFGERDWLHGFYWGRHKVLGDMFLLTLHGGDVGPSKGTLEGMALMDRDLDGWLDEARACYTGEPWADSLRGPDQWTK